MSTCPQCSQLLAAEATSCPACGHDLHTRRLADPPLDRDPERDRDELLSAAIADEGMSAPPPRWVASLEARLAPTPAPLVEGEVVADVLPEPEKKPRWRRRR